VFVRVEDLKRAQRFCDRMSSLDWPAIVNRLARRVNPLMGTLLGRMMIYPRALADAAKSIRRIQDFLGEYQDVCSAKQRLKLYAKSPVARQAGPAQLIALGRLRQRQEDNAKALRRQFPGQ
jgi:hypothetical protein